MPSTDPSSGTPIEGAVALVTGGHRGFGCALVDELLERGAAKVYATSRSSQPQRDPRNVPLVLDVADDASVAAAAQAAPEVSIVVNNAGILLATSVLGAPLSEIHAAQRPTCLGSSASRERSHQRSPSIPRLDGQCALGAVVAGDQRGL